MLRKDLINEIVEKINTKYNGLFICENHGCDMYFMIDGDECTIEAMCDEFILFEDDYHTVELIKADFQLLAYINTVI